MPPAPVELPADAPVFLLGIGAQKAGTTWLAHYLRGHPQCALGPVKEYHMFAGRYRPESFPKERLNRLRKLQALLAAQESDLAAGHEDAVGARVPKLLQTLDLVAMDQDPSRYLPHFDALRAARPGARLVADISPNYCTLSAAHLGEIRQMLLSGGYRVRVVFLLRDPIERCFSMLSMGMRNARKQGWEPATPPHVDFAAKAVKPWAEVRTRYELMLPEITRAFPPDELFIDLYERFFSPERVRALTDFLDLAPHPPNLSHRPNAAPREDAPTAGDIATLRRHYAPAYDACRAFFGREIIDSLWPHAVLPSEAD